MPSTNRNRQARKNRPAVGNESVPTGNATPKSMVPLYTGHEPTPGLERVGDILRRRRQQRGDELQPIADYLCIRKSFLVALENSDYDALPADAYVVGFLRSYAAYLGFDGTEAVNRYRGEMSGRRRKPALVLPTPIAEGRTPSALVMIGAAIVAVAIYVIWYSFSTSDRALVTAPPSLSAAPAAGAEGAPAMPIPGGIALSSPPPNELSSSTSGGPGQTVFSPAPGAPSIANTQAAVKPMHAEAPVAPEKTKPAAEKNPPAEKPAADKTAGTAVKGEAADAEETPPAASRLAIRAEKESWVVVTDAKGNTLLDKVMKPGDIFPVPNLPGLKLTTGNSGGIVLTLDGKDLPKLSRDSSALRDMPLPVDKLKAAKSRPRAGE